LFNVLPHPPGEYLGEMKNQLAYVLPALSQGRNHDRKNVQPIVEITAEFITRNHLGQIAMSGGNQTHVDVMRAAAAKAFELLFLQNAQEFRLYGQRQVPNFVKKKSAGISHFETADFLCYGPGKGTLLVPKQLTLQEIEGYGSAVKLHEGASAARTQIVNGMGDQFLPRSGFSQNQHSGISWRHTLHFRES
jgi:hypothetical protein